MPKFSKRHYEALAQALKSARLTSEAEGDANVRYGISLVEQRIRRVLQDDNPQFNDDLFRRASGDISEAQ